MWPSEDLASRLYNVANWVRSQGWWWVSSRQCWSYGWETPRSPIYSHGLGAMTSSAAKANERAAQANKAAEQERIEPLNLV